MSKQDFLPLGHHPKDQARGTKPPVEFLIERSRTYIMWAREYLAEFSSITDPVEGKKKLADVNEDLDKALASIQRLEEVLKMGYGLTESDEES